LNEALATELVCILRYKRHYFIASGINADAVAQEFLQHATEEQGHADLIAARIVQLKDEPNFNPDGLSMRSHAEYVEGDKDISTRLMLEGILAMEEEHADDLSSLLEDLVR
jgi:bacterioferritin